MISRKNLVYVEVVGDTAGGRLLRLNSSEWRRGEKLRMRMVSARMSAMCERGIEAEFQKLNPH